MAVRPGIMGHAANSTSKTNLAYGGSKTYIYAKSSPAPAIMAGSCSQAVTPSPTCVAKSKGMEDCKREDFHSHSRSIITKPAPAEEHRTHPCGTVPWMGIVLFLILGIWLGAGLLLFCGKEDMEVVTAFYVMAQIVTTIGYGDLTVQTSDLTKVFLSFYSIFTIIVIAWIITTAMQKIIDATNHGVGQRLQGLGSSADTDDGVHLPDSMVPRRELYCCCGPLFSSLALVLLALAIGTLFYGTLEKCTCSYGESAVDGCDSENCEETGGYVKTYLDAWYMSCISLTTVGFGDFAPKSEHGRAFACVWMIVGIVMIANFQVKFTDLITAEVQKRKQQSLDVESLFNTIDRDGSGELDRFEFLTFALMEYGLIDETDLEQIGQRFDALDKDGSGHLSRAEVMAAFGRLRDHDRRASGPPQQQSPSRGTE